MAAPIRLAGLADLAAVTGCVDAAFAPYTTLLGEPPPAMMADHGEAVAAGRVALQEAGGGVVGVLMLAPRPDELLIEILAVHPDHRARGIGRRLMGFAEGEARRLGAPAVRLFTHRLMTDAIAFYAALGYQQEPPTEAGDERVHLRKPIDHH
jgi:GNAT superfamily N-acetyltransferase